VHIVADWFAASREPNHQTPVLKEDGKIHIAPVAASSSRRGSVGKDNPPAVSSEEDAQTLKDEDEETKDGSSEKRQPSNSKGDTGELVQTHPEEDLDSDQTLLGVDGNEAAEQQQAKRFKGPPLDPGLEEYIRHGASKEYADAGLLKELERFYWKNLSYLSPMYGADLLGTLFEPDVTNSWNVAGLDNLLTRIQIPISGVNTPYLYFGLWKATFAWHLVYHVFALLILKLIFCAIIGGYGSFIYQVWFSCM
jgi:hypothetical protein